MHFISVFLFALSANIDNFIVGTAYGLRKVNLNFIETSIISSIILLGTIIAMAFGKILLKFIPIELAGSLGGSMIICMGVYYLIVFYKNRNKEFDKIEENKDNKSQEIMNENSEIKIQKLQYKESVILGFVLSINNAGLGIGASITGLNIVVTAIVSFVFSFMFIYLGNKLGNSWGASIIGKYAELVSGIIIIFLGCLEIYI
nr:manganese efflux pump [uncultured Aminipila sp.]